MLSKYMLPALIATTLSTGLFAYLYKEALQDVARVEEQAKREAAEAANNRFRLSNLRQQEAHAVEVAELEARMAAMNEATAAAQQRLAVANKRLSNFATQQRGDSSPEYAAWRNTKLPSSVVTRLHSLKEEDTIDD